MSKNVAMFVDVANLYYSARGQDVDVDYVALLKHATKGRDLIRAYAYSGLDPENENQRKFIDFLAKNGYKVLTKDIRKFGDGRVKANLDIELVVDLFRLRDRMDIAVIVSGDGDFAPAIRALQDEGVRCEVISFKPNTSSDLIAVADEFIDIMKIAGIGRAKSAEKGMSAPEMPAKEVTPEFGFREASASVAAAALAALKTGGSGGAGRSSGTSRGAGRSRGVRRPTAAEAPSAVATVAERESADDEPRRRRRRRGGRGRGRGRATQPEAAGVAQPGTASAEWDEIDDLSELEGLGEDREYTFQEADEATLLELGIAASPAEPDAASPAEKPRTRRTRTAPARDAGPTTAAAETRPRTRRTRASAPTTDAAAGEAPSARRTRRAPTTAETKAGTVAPRVRARSRRPSADSAAGAASGGEAGADAAEGTESGEQPQGIWGRFRSGRGSRSS